MKREVFIILLIGFFLVFSYSGNFINVRAVEETDYCDGKVFHYTGGEFTCTEGCSNATRCCGASREPCCDKNSSYGTECKSGATCVNKFCKSTGEEIPDEEETPVEKENPSIAEKETNAGYESNANIEENSICGGLDESECRQKELEGICEVVTREETISKKGCEKAREIEVYDRCDTNNTESTEEIEIIEGKNNICNKTNYHMAFLLVETPNHPASSEDIEKLNILKIKTSEKFSWATRGFASLNTSEEVFVLHMDETSSTIEITKEFYKTSRDIYDFLTIYNTYDNSGYMHHIIIKNQIYGIGLDIRDNTRHYGSNGTLLGVNWMRDIHSATINENLNLTVNGILHETSHQWGAFIDFIDKNGNRRNSLRNPYNMAHWDKKLETDYDLLNGFSWTDNGNGTFTAKLRDNRSSDYSMLDLYLMGLLSKDEIGEDSIKLIISDADTKFIQPGTTISGAVETISIQQIIDAEGERVCNN